MKAKYIVTCIWDDEITQHQCEAEIEEETKELYTKNLTEMYKRQLDFTKELVKKASET